MDGENLSWIATAPVYAWVFVLIIISLLLGTIILICFKGLKGKNINTPRISITEKTQLQAESRELSDNQMRGAREILSWVEVSLRKASDVMFVNQDLLERAYLDLLFKYISSVLLEQFRLDIVRNHIVKKTESELKEYSEAKAEIYHSMVKAVLSKHDSDIPTFCIIDLMDNITVKDFYEVYYKAYLNAKRLSVGY